MGFNIVSLGFLLGLFAIHMTYNDAAYLKWTNVICKVHNTTWIHLYECRLRAISRNVTVFNLNGTLDYPVNDVQLNLQLFKRANGYKPFLLKTTYDCCLTIKKRCNPIGKFIFNLYKNFSNFNHSCPYEGPFLIKGFHVIAEKFQLPLPTGQYMLETNWFIEKELQITVKVFFEFAENIIDM